MNIDDVLEKIKKVYGNSSDIVFRKLFVSKKEIFLELKTAPLPAPPEWGGRNEGKSKR